MYSSRVFTREHLCTQEVDLDLLNEINKYQNSVILKLRGDLTGQNFIVSVTYDLNLFF